MHLKSTRPIQKQRLGTPDRHRQPNPDALVFSSFIHSAGRGKSQLTS